MVLCFLTEPNSSKGKKNTIYKYWERFFQLHVIKLLLVEPRLVSQRLTAGTHLTSFPSALPVSLTPHPRSSVKIKKNPINCDHCLITANPLTTRTSKRALWPHEGSFHQNLLGLQGKKYLQTNLQYNLRSRDIYNGQS